MISRSELSPCTGADACPGPLTRIAARPCWHRGLRLAGLDIVHEAHPKIGLSEIHGDGSMTLGMKIRKIATISLLVLSSFAADNVAPSKTELEGMYDKAFREFDAGNYEQSLKDLDA